MSSLPSSKASPPRIRDISFSPSSADKVLGSRPRSPLTLPPELAESSIYQTAYQKLYDAAWKFDRDRNDSFLQAMETYELDRDLFRQALRSGLNCKLSNEELDSLMPHFNNNGKVNGCDFLHLLYRMRYDHGSKVLTERITRERKNREAVKASAQKLKQDLDSKNTLKVTFNFTEDERQSALSKLVEAAVKYDRLMPGSVQLDAFECEFMPPEQFKEQLKRVFNLNLSSNEFSAILQFVNKESGETNVNCARFLVTFFRMGFAERTKRIHDVREEKRRIEELRYKRKQEIKANLEKKNALKCNFDFSLEDKDRAMKKLKEAARLYDKSSPGAANLDAFETAFMEPHIFKEQLKRAFNLKLSPPELGALMSVYEGPVKGTISCSDFTKSFLALGFSERERVLREYMDKQRQAEVDRLAYEEEKKRLLANKNALNVNYDFSEEEFQSAMMKLTEAAWKYDKTMPGAPSMEAFESREMEPHIFKEQLKRAFNMKISPAELGALMAHFDSKGTGKVTCIDFVNKFIRLGIDERNRRSQDWRTHQQRLSEAKQKSQRDKLLQQEAKLELHVSEFSEEDFQSAMSKLTIAATKYSRSGPGAVGLDAFEAITMPPHVFKEQLKLVFGIKVDLKELAALMSYFEKDDNGHIICKDFVIQFLRTGIEERHRHRLQYLEGKRMKKIQDSLVEEAKKKEEVARAMGDVDYEFTEAEFDSALKKMIFIAHQFDRRQLGPAGLAAFDADALTPSEFKEMLRRTFGVKLSPGELGALVTYFDTTMKGMVNCSAFINAYKQIRVQCEDFKGKSDEQDRLLSYQNELKDLYRQRIQRQVHNSQDGMQKPWKAAGAISSKKASASIQTNKIKRPYPKTPMEKLKLRILIGKQTGRLDLASKIVWTNFAEGHKEALANRQKQQDQEQDQEQEQEQGQHHQQGQEEGKDENTEQSPQCDQRTPEEGQSIPNDERNSVELTETKNDNEEPSNSAGDNENMEAKVSPEEEDKGALSRQHSTAEEADSISIESDLENTSFVSNAQSIPADEVFHSSAVEWARRVLGKNFDPKLDLLALLSVHDNPAVDFQLSAIPEEVFRLKLSELWLCHNEIEIIPPQIGDLRQLRVLSLTGNGIGRLPAEIGLLENLQKLYLGDNNLSSLPELVSHLKLLTELNLSGNKFTTFPSIVISLSQLLHLDLSCNLLKSLPNSLIKMKSLSFLSLVGNPEFVNPPEVLEKMHWVEVQGIPLPKGDRAAFQFQLTLEDEDELEGLIRHRASRRLSGRTRRVKK